MRFLANYAALSSKLLELISEIYKYTTGKLCLNVLDGISNLESVPVYDSNRIRPVSLWRSGL